MEPHSRPRILGRGEGREMRKKKGTIMDWMKGYPSSAKEDGKQQAPAVAAGKECRDDKESLRKISEQGGCNLCR